MFWNMLKEYLAVITAHNGLLNWLHAQIPRNFPLYFQILASRSTDYVHSRIINSIFNHVTIYGWCFSTFKKE